MANRTVSVALRAEVAGFVNGLGTAAKSAKQFGDELDGMGKKSPQKLNDIAMAAGGLGAALVGMAGYAVHAAMAFDKQMSAVSAATKATAADMQLLREAALQAGKDTIFSASGAAEAQTELAKAGVSVRDILGGGLSGALDLAAAGTIGVGDAAEIAATAMTQFGLAGKDLPHVADLLAAGAGKAQGEVSDMGMALKQSGLVAAQFGVSIEETTGTLAAFASAGLIGSDAGTSFKTMLLMLANPSKQAAETMERLGISAYDAQGKFVGIRDLAEQLKTKMSGLSQAQRDQALATIFGSDAIRSANVLYKQGGDGIKDWTDKVNDSGFAADQAARKTDNLSGDLERLKGSIETAAIEAGSSSTGGLRFLTQTADELVTGFSNLNPVVSGTATVVAGLGGAGLLAFAGMVKVRSATNDALDALREMGPVGAKSATGLGKVATFAGRAGVALVAAQVASALLGAAVERDAPNIDRMSAALQKYAETGERAGELTKVFGKDFQQFGKDVKFLDAQGGLKGAKVGMQFENPLGIKILGNFDFSLTKTVERLKGLDDGLANMVKSGHAQQAAQMFEILAAQAKNNGVSAEQFKAMMPGYTGALADMANAAQGAGSSQQKAGEQARTMAAGLQEAMQAAGGLKSLFDQLNGVQINLTQAQIAAEAAVDGLAEALNESGGSLDLNTEKGRAAMQAGLDLAQAAAEVAQKTYDQNHNIDEASAVFNQYKQQLINTMVQSGMTRQAAENLANQIMQMPELKRINIETPGLDSSLYKVLSLKAGLNDLKDRSVTVTTYQNTVTGQVGQSVHQSQRFERWGGITEHAQTGLLREAHIASPMGPARYAYAEPATGGEAFVPRRGDYGRSMSILSQAASWYGARVVTGGGGGAVAVHLTSDPIPLTLNGRTVAELVISDGRNGGPIATYIKQVAGR